MEMEDIEFGQEVPLADYSDVLMDELENGCGESHSSDSERLLGYHPSQIKDRHCDKFFYLHYRFPSPHRKHGVKLQLIFDIGTDIHSRVQHYLRNILYGTWMCSKCRKVYGMNSLYKEAKKNHASITFSKDPIPMPKKCDTKGCKCTSFKYLEWRVINKDIGITGKIDGILKFPNSTEFVGLEIKSENVQSWAESNPFLITGYRKQFSFYLNALGLKTGVIMRVCKDSNEAVKSFFEKLSMPRPKTWLKAMTIQPENQAWVLEKMKAQKDNPVEPEAVECPECKNCIFAERCWGV